jgi:hypothetical protein
MTDSKESNEISEIKGIRSRGSKSASKGKSNDGSNSDITSPKLNFNKHRETSDKLDEYLDIKIDEQLNKHVKVEEPIKEDSKKQIVMHIEDYEDKTAKNEQIDDSNDI